MSSVRVKLIKSPSKFKKWRAVFYKDDEEWRHTDFGQVGYEDYTVHGDETRKQSYLARHGANQSWTDPYKAGTLARWVLWNKSSVQASFSDYKKRFNLQ